MHLVHMAAACAAGLLFSCPTAALLPNLDARFGNGGRVAYSVGTSLDDRGTAVAVQGDGRIVVGGLAVEGSTILVALQRLNADGSFDTSFGSGGKVKVSLRGIQDVVGALAIQPDGRIVAVGRSQSGSSEEFFVARFTAQGNLDTSFGCAAQPCTGWAVTSFGGSNANARAVVLQPDGKIVAAGESLGTGLVNMAFARYLGDGTPDPAFGCSSAPCSGAISLSLATPTRAYGVALQANGRIVATGEGSDGSLQNATTVRLLADGTLDPSFGTDGVAVTRWGTLHDLARSVAIRPDGRIVIIGQTQPAAGQDDFAVAQLNATGTLDSTFGTGGRSTADMTVIDGIAAGALATDGSIVAVGLSYVGHTKMAIVRFRPDGSVDPHFGWHVGTSLDIGATNTTSGAIAIAPNGHYLVVGTAETAPDHLVAVARFLPTPRERPFDFDRNNAPDIVFRHQATGDTWIWHMDFATFMGDQHLGLIDPSWRLEGFGDFNADGHNDVVWRNVATGNTVVWYLADGVYIGDSPIFTVDSVWKIEAIADFDGDGYPDFLFRHSATGVGFIWYFIDRVSNGSVFLYSISNNWVVEAVGDFNGDGKPDLFFRNVTPGSGLGFVWYWNGSALGGSDFLFSIDPVWQVLQATDWNGDGQADLLFRNSSTGVAFVWLMNGAALGNSAYLFQIDPVWSMVPSH